MDDLFVILHHTGFGNDHYDLMITGGKSLLTWQFLENPISTLDGNIISCIKIDDHRHEYLEYEGVISGNRGHVSRSDSGRARVKTITSYMIELELESNLMGGFFMLTSHPHQEKWEFRALP